jgi:alanine racemase
MERAADWRAVQSRVGKEADAAMNTVMPSRPTTAQVDLGAIAYNFGRIKSFVGPHVSVCAVVKADAYGHGAVPVSRCLEAQGAAMLAVAIAEEAHELRAAGLRIPILVLGQVLPSQVRALLEDDVRLTVGDLDFAEAVSTTARRAGIEARVHVKVDTGMSRLGILEEEAAETVRAIAALDRLSIEGIFTHFSSASEPDQSFTFLQLDGFRTIVQDLRESGIDIPLVHAANSAALLTIPESHLTMVRSGLALYGLVPDPGLASPVDLRPALSLRSRVVAVRDLPAGRPVSYGRTYRTQGPTRAAVLTLGYTDGLSRRLSNRAWVRIRGRLCPVIGRVCMDQTIVDVTLVPGVVPGDEAMVYEADRRSPLCIERVAVQAETVPHEVLCLIGKRVPRQYVDSQGLVDVECCTRSAGDMALLTRRAVG